MKYINLNDKTIIGQGKYGTVYKINNLNTVIKKFEYTKDYLIEKKMYRKILPIYIGKININKFLFIFTKCNLIDINNNNIIIDEFTINSNIISITNKQLLKLIQDTIISRFETILTISFNIITEGFISAKTISNIEYKIGHIIKHDNIYNLYIDTLKISKLINYDDTHKLLYFEYLGVNLSTAFKEIPIPDFNQRIFMCIDLIRQINYLINRGIYHNDIKCQNIIINLYNNNYYINLIDFGISISDQDVYLEDYLLTTYIGYSPEYYKINKKFKKDICKISEIRDLLDKSSHWIIAGTIINIINWTELQFPIWSKYYNDDVHFNILDKYSNIDICYNYLIEILNNFLFIEDFYINKLDIDTNINNIYLDIEKNKNNKDNKIHNIINIFSNNITYYKIEYIPFILSILNLLEYETYNKNNLDIIYYNIKLFSNYKSYIKSRKSFI